MFKFQCILEFCCTWCRILESTEIETLARNGQQKVYERLALNCANFSNNKTLCNARPQHVKGI